MLFNSCKAVCLVSAQQIPSESFPTAPPQQRASFRKKIITAVCLSMNLAEHTAANLALFESGALYLITFSRHIVRLAENLKNDTASWMQSKQWRISTIFDDCDADRLKECIVQ